MTIRYYCFEEHFDLFITRQVQQVVELLHTELGQTTTIEVYPETTYENWGIPNGLLIDSSAKEAILAPTFLRDPGSGFLMFKVEGSPVTTARFATEAGVLLQESLNTQGHLPRIIPDIARGDLSAVLRQGPFALSWRQLHESRHAFQATGFATERATLPSPHEFDRLLDDLGSIANTIELKAIHRIFDQVTLSQWNVSPHALVGFIHTGSVAVALKSPCAGCR